MSFEFGKSVRFPRPRARRARCGSAAPPAATGAACPATRRSAAGRAAPAPGHPGGRAKLRERVQAEHALAHAGRWQGRRARYLGTPKNLSGLRRVAVVHNLHVIARRPVTDSYELAT